MNPPSQANPPDRHDLLQPLNTISLCVGNMRLRTLQHLPQEEASNAAAKLDLIEAEIRRLVEMLGRLQIN